MKESNNTKPSATISVHGKPIVSLNAYFPHFWEKGQVALLDPTSLRTLSF